MPANRSTSDVLDAAEAVATLAIAAQLDGTFSGAIRARADHFVMFDPELCLKLLAVLRAVLRDREPHEWDFDARHWTCRCGSGLKGDPIHSAAVREAVAALAEATE